MAERRPPGFNVDLDFYDSPEVLSIPRKIRAAAVGVWALAGSYSAKKLTDGYVSAEKLRELGCTPTIRAALMATRPEPLWVDGDHVGDIRFTRWTKWQRTSVEVKAYREAEAERKRKAREAAKGTTTSNDSEMSGRTYDGQPPDVRPEDRDPRGRARARQTETKPKTELPGYVPESATQSNARDGIAATPQAELVRRTIPPRNQLGDANRATPRRRRTAAQRHRARHRRGSPRRVGHQNRHRTQRPRIPGRRRRQTTQRPRPRIAKWQAPQAPQLRRTGRPGTGPRKRRTRKRHCAKGNPPMTTTADALEVMTLVAACHHRTAPRIDDIDAARATASVWADLFAAYGLELPDLLAAVKKRALTHAEAPEPAEIIAFAREIRRDRAERESDDERQAREDQHDARLDAGRSILSASGQLRADVKAIADRKGIPT